MISDERLDEIENHVKAGGDLSILTLRELFITIRALKDEISVEPVQSVPLSRRDWFAGMAMGHVISKVDSMKVSPEKFLKGVALTSIEIADAMLAELDKEGK